MEDKIEIKKQEQLYETSNFVLAVYLLYCGFNLWGIKKDNKDQDRKIFVFEKNDDLEKALEIFWRKEARVEPENFWLVAKLLKSRIYDRN